MARNKGKKRSKYVSEQIKKEYRKQRSRIQRFIRNASKRGYQFQENVLPKIPKTVTQQSINRLQKITPASLYEKARVYFNETEFYTGTEYRHIENVERARKASETRHYRKYDMNNENIANYVVIERVRQLIENSGPKTGTSLYTPYQRGFLLDIMERSIAESDNEKYAEYLLENESRIAYLVGRIEYASKEAINVDLFRQLQLELSYYTPDLVQMQEAQEISDDTFRTLTVEEMGDVPFL